MNKLSLTLEFENNSTNIAEIIVRIFVRYEADDKKITIIDVVIINEKEPSNDLLKNFVDPYLIPIIAAAESDILITNKAIIAICSSKNNIVMAEPINIHDAPDKL